jgi:hypothetical protein
MKWTVNMLGSTLSFGILLPVNWADSKLPKTMSLSCYEHCHRKKKAAAHMVAAAFHEKAP